MDDQEDVLRDFRDPDDRAPAAASSFRDLGLRSRMLYALEKAGLERPSFVQSEAIPVAIQGKDLICQAPSGMGKTIVFVVGVLQQLETYGTVQCITLLHARELAVQVASEFERIGKHVSANVGIACCHPELALAVQKKQLAAAKPTIVVGTPGRVLGLCRSKAINCNNVKHFIIDECDAMLGSLDVRSTVQDVFRLTPITKQVMMMATTLSAEALETARKFTRNVCRHSFDFVRGWFCHFIVLRSMYHLLRLELKPICIYDYSLYNGVRLKTFGFVCLFRPIHQHPWSRETTPHFLFGSICASEFPRLHLFQGG
eukprot:RCo015032